MCFAAGEGSGLKWDSPSCDSSVPAPAPGGKAKASFPAVGGGGTREFATGCVSLSQGGCEQL